MVLCNRSGRRLFVEEKVLFDQRNTKLFYDICAGREFICTTFVCVDLGMRAVKRILFACLRNYIIEWV